MWSMVLSLLFSYNLLKSSILVFMLLFTFMVNYVMILGSSSWYYVSVLDWLINFSHLKMLFVLLSMMMLFMLYKLITKNFYKMLLVLLTIFNLLFFLTKNLILFYMFFELSIMPMLLIILIYGVNPERLNAGMYMMIYTLVGSIPLLFGMIFFIEWETYSFDLMLEGVKSLSCSYDLNLYVSFLSSKESIGKLWLSITNMVTFLLVFSFLMKLPLYGLHLWLPKAHVEAPTEGSMVLASVLLKLGVYGLIRMNQLMFHNVDWLSMKFLCWGVWGLLMVSLICFRKMDLKIIMAYSSVFHMLLVIFMMNSGSKLGLLGLLLLSMGHGFCSSLLFFKVGVFYYSSSSRNLKMNSGLMWKFPLLVFFWLGGLVIKCKFPPSIKFFSELMIFYCSSSWIFSLVMVMMWSVFMGGLYKIYMYMVSSHGKISQNLNNKNQIPKKTFFMSMLHFILNMISVVWWWLLYNNSVFCTNNFLLFGGLLTLL